MKHVIELRVNGLTHEVMVSPSDLLIDVLRGPLGLTGSKQGCGTGDCGACTVLVDGRPALACLTLVLSCRGKDIRTIEGLQTGGQLDPLQQAFMDHGAVHCGFCTPGMIMSAKALLMDNPRPSEEEIRRNLAGNLCRCTGYVKIIEAIQSVAAQEYQ